MTNHSRYPTAGASIPRQAQARQFGRDPGSVLKSVSTVVGARRRMPFVPTTPQGEPMEFHHRHNQIVNRCKYFDRFPALFTDPEFLENVIQSGHQYFDPRMLPEHRARMRRMFVQRQSQTVQIAQKVSGMKKNVPKESLDIDIGL